MKRHQSALFDRMADPAYQRDLSDVDRERARALRKQLIDWLNLPRAGPLGQALELSPERLRELSTMGYSSAGAQTSSKTWIAPDCGCDACAAALN